MKPLDWLAAAVLFLELPVPLYWLILHAPVRFWRRRLRTAYWVAGLSAWAAGGVFLYALRERLFTFERMPGGPTGFWVAVGLVLIACEIYLLYRVERELGGSRMVGQVELQGGGELATQGLYARIRHPRYTGMFLAVLGACLIARTRLLWGVALVWWLLALAVVSLEERELRARFGEGYIAYARRVPRFLPFRLRPRSG